jgi:hypothetical protein
VVTGLCVTIEVATGAVMVRAVVLAGGLKERLLVDPPSRMLLEPRRMDMMAVAIPSDEDSCVAPEVEGEEEDINEADAVATVVADAVGVVVPEAVGTFRVYAVGGEIDVEVGVELSVPGVTMTAWAVRAVLLAKVSTAFGSRWFRLCLNLQILYCDLLNRKN